MNKLYSSIFYCIFIYIGLNSCTKANPSEDEDLISNFKSLLSEEEYENIFPKRYGFYNNINGVTDKSKDFFTYKSLLDAIKELSNIKIEIYKRQNTDGTFVDYATKVVWNNKLTEEKRENITNPDYNASWNIVKKEILVSSVDYSDFCNKGSLNERKRELCAFLANISHETTGGGFAEKTKTWGLYWREETYWQLNPNTTNISYISPNLTYPPYPGKSYHGRGPIQLSWNYNYGPVSECVYGDKNILLKNPEKVLENGTNAFITGIWFWMTPQSPKPSCHEVMVGDWQPSDQDISLGRNKSKFGMTINIINGGLECGSTNWDYRGLDRVEFYKRYLTIMKIDKDNDICSCIGMQKY